MLASFRPAHARQPHVHPGQIPGVVRMKKTFLAGFVFVLCAGLLLAQKDDAIAVRAKRLHFSSLVFDTHVDTTSKLLKDWKFTEEHKSGHIDLPRMNRGGLNALFFSVYVPGTVTGPKAVNDALERIAAIHKLTQDISDRMALCVNAAQVREARKKGKIAALIGMEGGHMINDSLPILRMYALLGVRYLTLTHSVDTDWADSSGDKPIHDGLTAFGKEVVRELNRQGILVDISHVSDKTFWDALEVSKAPMIASHSSCRALCRHPRNMTDEMIKALAAKGGVIQINYHVEFLDDQAAEYFKKAEPVYRQLMEKQKDKEDFTSVQKEAEKLVGPLPQVSWERIIDHIDHAVKLVGADHVGLGSDFDGAVMPQGMDNVTMLPRITEALLRRGYSEPEVRKILGENTLRLLDEVAK